MDKNADEKSGIKTAGATPGFQRTQRRSSRRTGRWVGSSVRSSSSSRAERKSENRESAVEFLRGAEDGLVSEPMWGNEGQDELVSEVEWGSGERDISGNYLDEDIVVGETSGDLASAVGEAGGVRDVAGEGSGLSRERGFYNEKKNSSELEKAEDETKVGKGASGLNEKEESGAGRIPFTGGQDASGKKKEKKMKGFFKRGPVIAIIGLIAIGIGLGMSSLSFMPFALTELATELYDQLYTARTARMPKLAKYVFELEDETAATQKVHKIFGDDYVKYRKSALRHKRGLANQGIEIVGNGKSKKLEWTHQKWDTDPSDGQYKLMSVTETITADDYAAKYASDVDFRNSFNKGTRSFTGRIAGWIDLSAAKFFDKFAITKTLFSGWIESVAKREGDQEFLETIKARRKEMTLNDSTAVKQIEEEELDENGNPVKDENGNVRTKTSSKVQKAADVAGAAANIAQMASGAVCGLAAMAATVTGIKAVITTQNAINLAQAGNEAVQKTKIGHGVESPTNSYANMLTARDKDGYYPLLAQGLLYIVSGGTHKVEMDAETMSMNLEELYKSWGTTIGAVIGCTAVQGVTALISFAADAVGAVLAPGFGVLFTDFAKKAVVGAVAGVAFSDAMQTLVASVQAQVTTDQCTEKMEFGEGINASLAQGACLAFGFTAELTNNALSGGSSPADSEKAAENKKHQALALQYEAEYDRANYSPFDVTNKNTFFGSLARTVATSMATFGGNGSLVSFISGMSSAASKSMAAIVPGANAAMAEDNLIGDCPSLQSIGLQGYADGSCFPIAVNDMDTMGYDPEENLVEIAETYNGFEKDGDTVKVSGGVEQIDEKSNLGKYIDYCVNRDAPFGTIDQAIIDKETPASTGDSTADAALNGLPFVGDFIDIVNSGYLLTSDTLGWASGATCGARSGSNASADTIWVPSSIFGGQIASTDSISVDGFNMKIVPWDEIKHYAQYVTDDKIMETADPENYNSAVMAYIEKQEEKNPVDNSFEGWLARRTGQRKETIAYALNEVKYWTYVADYDATDKYPRVEKQKEFQIQEVMPDEMEMPGEVLAKREQNVVYEDLRRVVIG